MRRGRRTGARRQRRGRHAALVVSAVTLAAACVLQQGARSVPRHGWWSGLGPVLPHETFPADCELCHVARDWQSLRDDFTFDHEAETGVALEGAHAGARCLRCHNDRGPVERFAARGCAGCHEDVHVGELGVACEDCHVQESWVPVGQVALHEQTRFPLVGVHAATSCRRCHPGAEIGQFVPTDVECVTCHRDDLARARNPDHLALGLVADCDRCHLPTSWDQAEID